MIMFYIFIGFTIGICVDSILHRLSVKLLENEIKLLREQEKILMKQKRILSQQYYENIVENMN